MINLEHTPGVELCRNSKNMLVLKFWFGDPLMMMSQNFLCVELMVIAPYFALMTSGCCYINGLNMLLMRFQLLLKRLKKNKKKQLLMLMSFSVITENIEKIK